MSGRGDAAANYELLYLRCNADGGANYSWWYEYGGSAGVGGTLTEGQTAAKVADFAANSLTAGYNSALVVDFFDYANTVYFKTFMTTMVADLQGTGGFVEHYGGMWLSESSITEITLFLSAGNFAAGTRATLYALS